MINIIQSYVNRAFYKTCPTTCLDAVQASTKLHFACSYNYGILCLS